MKNIFLVKRMFVSILSFLLVSSVNAAIISFEFSGSIISSLDGIVPLNTRFSGSFSYDDGLSGFSLSDNTVYHPVDFSLSIDNTDIDFVGSIVVNNDSTTSFPGSDIIQIGLFNITPIPVLNGAQLTGIEIGLVDNTGIALNDEGLPLTYDLSDWMVGGRTLAIRSLASGTVTVGRIESIAPAVPIPAAFWLFASGLVGLLGVIKRGKGIKLTEKVFRGP